MPARAKSTAPIPPEAIAAAALAMLRSADRPLPISTLVKTLGKEGLKVKAAALTAVLDGLVRDGRIHEHPIARQTKAATRRFWHGSPQSYVDQVLATTIASGGEWTEAQLKKPIEIAYRDLFDEGLGRLIAAGHLYASATRGTTRRFQTAPPRPTDSLTAPQRKALDGVISRVNAIRRPPIRMDELLALLDGPGAGVASSASAPSAPAPKALTLEMLMAFYAADLPRREGLRSMPIPWTWRRYADDAQRSGTGPDKRAFHRMLRDLAEAGRIALTRHDTPGRLGQDELDLLEQTPDGGIFYYWTPMESRT